MSEYEPVVRIPWWMREKHVTVVEQLNGTVIRSREIYRKWIDVKIPNSKYL